MKKIILIGAVISASAFALSDCESTPLICDGSGDYYGKVKTYFETGVAPINQELEGAFIGRCFEINSVHKEHTSTLVSVIGADNTVHGAFYWSYPNDPLNVYDHPDASGYNELDNLLASVETSSFPGELVNNSIFVGWSDTSCEGKGYVRRNFINGVPFLVTHLYRLNGAEYGYCYYFRKQR